MNLNKECMIALATTVSAGKAFVASLLTRRRASFDPLYTPPLNSREAFSAHFLNSLKDHWEPKYFFVVPSSPEHEPF